MKPEELRMQLRRALGPADVGLAVGPCGADCLTDREAVEFAAGETTVPDLDRILHHLRACPRCFHLVLLLSEDTPSRDWAKEATQAATRRWLDQEREGPDATVMVLPFPAMSARLVAIAAARPQARPATVTLDAPRDRYRMRVVRAGEPLVGVEVTLRSADGDRRLARTDAWGVAEFIDLPAGRHVVSIAGCDEPIRVM